MWLIVFPHLGEAVLHSLVSIIGLARLTVLKQAEALGFTMAA